MAASTPTRKKATSRAGAARPKSDRSSLARAGRAYGGRSPAERALDRRARLLDSALELFGTEGYAATSIERLCSHSGVTARHFYEAFPGREDLLLGLMNQLAEGVRVQVATALEQPESDPRRRMLKGVDALVAGYLADLRVARIMSLEVVGVSPRVEARRREVLRDVASIVEAEAAHQALALGREVHDFRWTAVAMAGATFELIAHTVQSKRPLSVSQLRRELMQVYLALTQGYELARDDLAELGLSSGPGKA